KAVRGQRVYTKSVFTWTGEGYRCIKSTWHEYAGPLAIAKGEGTAKDQLNQQNQLQRDAYNNMLARQNQVGGAVSKYLSGNVGYDPQQLALLKSQFLNQNAATYNT